MSHLKTHQDELESDSVYSSLKTQMRHNYYDQWWALEWDPAYMHRTDRSTDLARLCSGDRAFGNRSLDLARYLSAVGMVR